MKALEFTVSVIVLAAIASTFFLYRQQATSPRPTDTLTEPISAGPSQTAVVVSSTSNGTITTLAPEARSDQVSTTHIAGAPTTTTDIVVEELPLTQTESNTIISHIHSLSSLSRSQNNLPSLILDSRLSTLATDRSKDMLAEDYFSHTTKDGCDLSCRFKNVHYNTLTWGENLATSATLHLYTPEDLAKMFLEEWLKSSTHRDNLLSTKFTHYGIGLDEKGDRIVVTVIFAKPQ